jgi:hypothetical protein
LITQLAVLIDAITLFGTGSATHYFYFIKANQVALTGKPAYVQVDANTWNPNYTCPLFAIIFCHTTAAIKYFVETDY